MSADGAAQDGSTKGNADGGSARGRGRRAAEPVLPRTAAEDDPRAWGDSDADHDGWLREQRPPHWG